MEAPKIEGSLVINKRTGEPFSQHIVKAGNIARSMLNDMGEVFRSGLRRHKKVITQAFLHTSEISKADQLTPLGKRIKRYREKIDQQISDIKAGMENGDYFPHILMEYMMKISINILCRISI